MLNSITKNHHFKSSFLYSYFKENPLIFCDVGARGGIHDYVYPFAECTNVIGFEPSRQECERLGRIHDQTPIFNNLELIDKALYSKKAEIELNHTVAETNSSIYKVNPIYLDRYKLSKWETIDAEKISTTSIELCSIDQESEKLKNIDFLKIDTQGSEYEILEGCQSILRNSITAVVAEVSFFEIYSEQKSFTDVTNFLRSLGFSFYGFHSMHTRSRRGINKKTNITRERLMQADAVYFKDPFDSNQIVLSQDKLKKLYIVALLLEYYDLALEIAEHIVPSVGSEEYKKLKALAYDLSEKPAKETIDEFKDQISLALKNPSDANQILGALIDKYRLYNDYKDLNFISSLPSNYNE